VITDNHLGDYGAPLGVWITGFLKFSSEEALEKDGVYELGRVYIEMKKALKEEKEQGGTELAEEVQAWLLKFESGDEEAKGYSERFNKISLEHIHRVMDRLKISTEYELGEAYFAPKGKDAVQKLLETGVAVQNEDGSIIVPLDDYGYDVPLLVQKSNGAALYATSDLATILYRENEWHPDKVIYAVGAEQQFYFAQLFAMAKKLGITTELIHLWFGTIDQIGEDGTREKMSSRKGVVLMEELLDQAEARAREVVADRDVSEDDIKKIALGAIKFSDFISDRRTNILFDWNSIFALSGFSGPYIQYAAVRVNKILGEYGEGSADINNYDYEAEKAIIAKLLEYPGVVALSARDLEPHRIAAYLYELARDLNRYYEATPVATGEVTDEQKAARLGVLAKVSQVFTAGLDLLGIEVPSRM
jgi:arginyl-tRNA synthetase